MDEKLKIGKIPYANLFPIFYCLEKGDTGGYEFVEGYPSALNRMLREGKLDVSPSSSIEYLRGMKSYSLIEGHSISSFGPVKSIILFSRVPIESLGGQIIYVTHQSDTSVALLEVILKKFYGEDCKPRATSEPFKRAIKAHSAYLAIGDEALTAGSAANMLDIDLKGQGYGLGRIGFQSFYIYDLGELWHRHTGLPFVFALWIARRDAIASKKGIFDRLKEDLDRAKRLAMESLPEIAGASAPILSPTALLAYWRGISYDLSEEHMKGLELFRKYLVELGII